MGKCCVTIWMVSGLHDPRWADNIRRNFDRQTYADRKLLVVENGAGRGAMGMGVRLTSKPGAAAPLNVALDWLWTHAAVYDWFCKCDADDYYGPGYLESIATAIVRGADYCGRSSLYVKTTTGRLWYAEGAPDETSFHGPTIAGRISLALQFPDGTQWGEDDAWCRDMRAAGRRSTVLAPEGFCYQRHADYRHTWPCSDYDLRVSWPVEFLDLGAIDYRVVNGTVPRPAGIRLAQPSVAGVDDLMAVRVLQQSMEPSLQQALDSPEALRRFLEGTTR